MAYVKYETPMPPPFPLDNLWDQVGKLYRYLIALWVLVFVGFLLSVWTVVAVRNDLRSHQEMIESLEEQVRVLEERNKP